MAGTALGYTKGREGRLKAREKARDKRFAEGCEKATEGKKRRSRTTYAYLGAIVGAIDIEDTKVVAQQ